MRYYLLSLLLVSMTTISAIAQGLSGTYTIDPANPTFGNNFQSFTDVCFQLNSLGVSGPVIFEVKQGAYNDSIYLEDINGSSSTNLIRFIPAPTNTSDVVIQTPKTGQSNNAIRLTDTKHVHFEDLKFDNSFNLNYLINYDGNLENIAFKSCHFDCSASNFSTWSTMNSFGANFEGLGLIIDNCVNRRSRSFIRFQNLYSQRNITVTNCDIEFELNKGIEINGIHQIEISNNIIHGSLANSSQNVVLRTARDKTYESQTIINNNRITTEGQNISSLLLYSGLGDSLAYLEIKNNFFESGTLNQQPVSGIKLNYPDSVRIINNTIQLNTTEDSKAVEVSSTSLNPMHRSMIMQNNIVAYGNHTPNSQALYIYGNVKIGRISHNIFYGHMMLFPYYMNEDYASLSSFESNAGVDNNYYGEPEFVQQGDFKLKGLLAYNRGTNIPGLTTDIEGEARPQNGSIDIGCDEFAEPPCASPIFFEANLLDTSRVSLQWQSGSSSIGDYIEYGLSGFTLGQGTRVAALTNSIIIDSLIRYQVYDFYVYSHCTGGDSTDYVGPQTISTFDIPTILDYDFKCYPGGFQDISQIGSSQFLAQEGVKSVPATINFQFQGEPITSFDISENGGLMLNAPFGVLHPNNGAVQGLAFSSILPFWEDLYHDTLPIYYHTRGTYPNREFIAQWNHKPVGYFGDSVYQFQIILVEGISEAYIQYKKVNIDAFQDFGAKATIGYSGPFQDNLMSFEDTELLKNHSCIRLYHTDCVRPKISLNAITDSSVDISLEVYGENPESFEIVLGPSGFDPNTGGSSYIVYQNDTTISGLNEQSSYDIYVVSNCDSVFSSQSVATFTTLSLCSTPHFATNFYYAPEQEGRILWNWNEYEGHTLDHYELYFGQVGFNPGVEGYTFLPGTDNRDTILDPTLQYGLVREYYVRAFCATDTSALFGPIKFQKWADNDEPCEATSLPVDSTINYLTRRGGTIISGIGAIYPPITGYQQTNGWGGHNDSKNGTWYTFVAPNSGEITVDMSESNYNIDSRIALYDVGDCNDFSTYQLIGANDNSRRKKDLRPNANFCGLIPGQTYYLLHDIRESVSANFMFNMRLYPADLPLGTIDQGLSICNGDSTLLDNYLSDFRTEGSWGSPSHPLALSNSNWFNASGLSNETAQLIYRVTEDCVTDTAFTSIYIKPLPEAGNQFMDTSFCIGESFYLTDLIHQQDHGGTWVNHDYPNAISNDSLFQTAQADTGFQTSYYRSSNSCGVDSTGIIIYIEGQKSAGEATTHTICYVDGLIIDTVLTSNTDYGGYWIDSNGNIMSSTVFFPGTFTGPGTMTFMYYIEGNKCEDDSSYHTIILNDDCVAGLTEQKVIKLSLYPNPAKNEVRIYTNIQTEHLPYALMDMTGKIIQQGDVSTDSKALNIEHLAPGVYSIAFNIPNTNKKVLRFVKH